MSWRDTFSEYAPDVVVDFIDGDEAEEEEASPPVWESTKGNSQGIENERPGLVEGVVKTTLANSLPGAGTLFNYSAGDGLSFTPLGRNILLAAAAYGAWRMLAGAR